MKLYIMHVYLLIIFYVNFSWHGRYKIRLYQDKKSDSLRTASWNSYTFTNIASNDWMIVPDDYEIISNRDIFNNIPEE